MAGDLHRRRRLRAYELLEEERLPDDAELKHWLQAMDEVAGDDEHETLEELIDDNDRGDDRLSPNS